MKKKKNEYISNPPPPFSLSSLFFFLVWPCLFYQKKNKRAAKAARARAQQGSPSSHRGCLSPMRRERGCSEVAGQCPGQGWLSASFRREGSAPFCCKGEGRVKESPWELADGVLSYTLGRWVSRRKGSIEGR